jgi:hypothetical protein
VPGDLVLDGKGDLIMSGALCNFSNASSCNSFLTKFGRDGKRLKSQMLTGRMKNVSSIDMCSSGTILTVGRVNQADTFVAKLSADWKTTLYFTRLGDSGDELPVAIKCSKSGNAIVAGVTFSDNFPSPDPNDVPQDQDSFVVNLSSKGHAVVYALRIGGSESDRAVGLDVDAEANVYLAGETYSDDFPVTPEAEDTKCNSNDGYIVMIAP